EYTAEESTGNLRGDVAGDFGPRKGAERCQRDCDSRIQMRAADAVDAVDADCNSERPARRDDDPAGVVAFTALEEDVGDDAVAEDDEDRCAEQLSEESGHDRGRVAP